MPKKKESIDRRNFLKGAALGAAAVVANPSVASAQPAAARPAAPVPPRPPEPRAADISAARVLTTDRPGADFMVDAIKSLNIEYVCANPGSDFRGLHESLINYGGNKTPEFITCTHEESSVAIGHGYAKIEGKPLLALAHGTVGLQHASMALYNAYCDRVPVMMIVGNTMDVKARRANVVWDHSALDAAAMVRDYTKWDDQPASLQHFAESVVRAYKIAMTPPMMPVLLVADTELQERPVPAGETPRVPKLTLASPPLGDSGAVKEAARLLAGAENPLIVVDRGARTAEGLKLLVELAETLQAAVIDQGGRMNFPSRHALNQTDRARAVIANADVILGLEVSDLFDTVNFSSWQMDVGTRPLTKPGVKMIAVSSMDLYLKSNYQDFQRYVELELAIAADAEATLPSLIEAVKVSMNDDRRGVAQERGKKLAAARQAALEQARTEATYGWDASPVSTGRLCAELWGQIKNEDWSLVSDVSPWVSRWPQRLWSFDKYYQFIGGPGAYGIGYGAPAAVGAALANRKYGRLSVNIQGDGDLMYAPGVLWTAAHHNIPLLSIMHNNRGYQQEVMLVQQMADEHNRGITRAGIGTTITDPNIDYAGLAKSLGVHGEGPITDPAELGPAIKRAIEVVKRGEPALIDLVTQPR
jgi:thiamine pyrophosphate-dependent acetolactate synthase large subunit-like protein